MRGGGGEVRGVVYVNVVEPVQLLHLCSRPECVIVVRGENRTDREQPHKKKRAYVW